MREPIQLYWIHITKLIDMHGSMSMTSNPAYKSVTTAPTLAPTLKLLQCCAECSDKDDRNTAQEYPHESEGHTRWRNVRGDEQGFRRVGGWCVRSHVEQVQRSHEEGYAGTFSVRVKLWCEQLVLQVLYTKTHLEMCSQLRCGANASYCKGCK